MLKLIFLTICLGIFASGRADGVVTNTAIDRRTNERNTLSTRFTLTKSFTLFVKGKGLWSLISISECPDENLTTEALKCDVNKHKLNRTQDGISAHIVITEEITEEYGIFIDICKYVDGGCKQYQIVSDNMGKLCDKYAKDNVIRALQMGNFNTEYLPIAEGEYDLEDFIFDYCALPPECPYGTYEAVVYLLLNQQRVSCLKVIVECKKCEEDEDCCDHGEE